MKAGDRIEIVIKQKHDTYKIGDRGVIKYISIAPTYHWYVKFDNGNNESIREEHVKVINDMKTVELNEENLITAWNGGCSDVKKVLENLYPDVDFEKDQYVEFSSDGNIAILDKPGCMTNTVTSGEDSVPKNLFRKCIILNERYNWEIIDNPKGCTSFNKLLVAKKKKK